MQNQPETTYQNIVENLNEGLYFVNKDRVITYWNTEAEKITGFLAEQVVGHACSEDILTHIDEQGCSLCKATCPLHKTMEDGKGRESELFLHHKNGQRLPVLVRVTPLYNDRGEIIGGAELFTDISTQKANQYRIQELERLAMLDPVTELANRSYLEKELNSRMEEYLRYSIPFGILLADVDDFFLLRKEHGPKAAEWILKAFGDTFVANARPFDLFGRWENDCFLAIIRNIGWEDLKQLAERFRTLLENNYLFVNGMKVTGTVSMGATMIQHNDQQKSLLQRACDLLKESKRNGKNQVTMNTFSPLDK